MPMPSRTNPILRALGASAWLACACACFGQAPVQPDPSRPVQPRKDPQSDPGLSDPSLDDEISGHRKAGAPAAPIPPTPPKPAQKAVPSVPAPIVDAPGISGADFSLP